MIAVVGLVAILISGIAIGTFLVIRGTRDDASEKQTAPVRTTTAPASPGPTVSTESPQAPGPSDSPSSGLTAPYAPTDDTDDDIYNDVRASDYPGDWDFRLGDVTFHAKLVRAVDHPTCGPVEKGGALTRQRCAYAVQLVYNAFRGKARLAQLFLVFEDQRRATAAQKGLTDDALSLSADSTLAGGANGRWTSSVHGNVVVVTVGTSTDAVADRRLTRIINYMNTDFRLALSFR